MSQPQEISPMGRLVFGGIVAAAGFPIVLIGLGILKPDPNTLHAPLWVALCAGLAFMLAGATVAMGAASKDAEPDGSLPRTAPLPLRIVQYVMGLGIVSSLALVGSWIAFGPGERNFKSSVSFLGLSQSFVSGETIGRAMFGIGAILSWLMVIAVAKAGWRKLFAGDRPNESQPGLR